MESIDRLTKYQFDILKEIGNIGAGHSATALSRLLDKKISMNVPSVKPVSFNELVDLYGGPEEVVACVYLKIDGEFQGSMFFIMSVAQAEKFIKILTLNEEFSLDSNELTGIGYSVIQELGNILTGSYLSAMADITGLIIYPSVPDVTIDMFGAVMVQGLVALSYAGDHAILIDTKIKEETEHGENVVEGHFFLLPDPETIGRFFQSLGADDENRGF
ncbi:chemotaxis protein CheC [Metabacillus sp. RGM 3146]|uniref:chemotaxis protein CheC n=1 Tax=Metabacillus sp. RGM 3146 TaxID=3401092 RepID=UPI003B9BEE9F